MIDGFMRRGLTKQDAESLTEYDYYLMIVFKNLEGLKEKYLIDKNK